VSRLALSVCGVVLWAFARLKQHVVTNKIMEKRFRLAIMQSSVNVFLAASWP
jgi:hypothetical protein